MAYMSQEKKKAIAAALKAALAGSGLKYSLAVRHHSTLVLTIYSGPVDFIGERNFSRVPSTNLDDVTTYLDVNPYHFRDQFVGKSLEVLTTIFACLNDGNWDKSDIQSDYFNVGWYVDVNVGSYRKPYQFTGELAVVEAR